MKLPTFAKLAVMEKRNRKLSRDTLNALIVLSVFCGVVQIAGYTAAQIHWEFDSVFRAIVYAFIIATVATCLIMLVIRDRQGRVRDARLFSRALVALLLLAFAFDMMFVKNTPLSSVFVVQFLCVIAYQMRNDPNLDRAHPKEGGFLGAIPLSYFNLFWIFLICSVIGLFGETVVSAIRDGRWESRAGLVLGPFSPIYGFGGMLITVALNRIDKRPVIVQFIVAGVVGAAFEFFAGWLWETAFGIVAWSYEGMPLDIGGHTSGFMACVWGAVGVLWMRFVLPQIMRVIDLIPLKARAPITLVLSTVLLADGILTVICMNCWYLRMAGIPVTTPWQEFCAQYFGDDFMQSRFETMSMWPVLASR